ncbi:MAG: hypothetical protein QXQ40_01450 [Candidatus Aenigmatarchaeota archaeon]
MKTIKACKNLAKELFITQPRKVMLRIEESKKVLEAHIDDDCNVALTRDERKRVETLGQERKEMLKEILQEFERSGKDVTIDSNEIPLNFSAGGLLHTNGKNVVVLKRDENAPSYPNYLTSCCGHAENLREVLYPRIVQVREGLEEVLYIGDEMLYVPDIRNLSKSLEGTRHLSFNEIEKIIRRIAKQIGLKPRKIKRVEAEIIDDKDSVVRVFYNGKKFSETISKFNIDPEIAEIDLLSLLYLDFSSVDSIYDGELNYEGSPLDRKVYIATEKILRTSEGKKIPLPYYKSGKRFPQEDIELKYVPQLKESLRLFNF